MTRSLTVQSSSFGDAAIGDSLGRLSPDFHVMSLSCAELPPRICDSVICVGSTDVKVHGANGNIPLSIHELEGNSLAVNPAVDFHFELGREEGDTFTTRLGWISSDSRNLENVARIAAQHNISERTLRGMQRTDQLPKTFFKDSGNYRVIVIDEVSVKPDGSLESHDLSFVIKNGKLFTFSQGESAALARVAEELRDGEIIPDKVQFSSWLACRIIGSLSYRLHEIAKRFGDSVNAFVSSHETKLATPESRARLKDLKAQAHYIETAAEGLRLVLGLFNDKDNFFGAPRRYHNLSSYGGQVQEAVAKGVQDVERKLAGLRVDWTDNDNAQKAAESKKMNGLLFRIAVVQAVSVPVSLTLNFYGASLDHTWTTKTVATGICVALLVATGLLWGLDKDKAWWKSKLFFWRGSKSEE